ncbi:MAG: hypothetical protein LH477_05740 [Nocardioides sp.]|nr:hypothetical protein [Nocardioides sp.]
MLFPATSYGRALTYPGSASWQERTVEWVRENGAATVVNTVENWVYTRHAPSAGSPDAATVPAWLRATPVRARADQTAPAPVAPLAMASSLPGEGIWVPGRRATNGTPATYTTVIRPDRAYPSVLVGAAWIRASDTTAHLVPGTRQPGGSWPGDARISKADVPALVATFNSGWKYKDMDGGFYLDGRTAAPLRDGRASVVIDRNGAITIGQWGRDVALTRSVTAVRQNLDLVVDKGRAAVGLNVNGAGRWGSAKNQLQYTWRSGLGTDAQGNLVYVAGGNLTLQTLADAMVDAGVQRGMELDIHPGMTSFATWAPTSNGSAVPTKLLPGMSKPADRYLVPDQRDFFYLTLR